MFQKPLRIIILLFNIIVLAILLPGCDAATAILPAPTPPAELVFFNWAGDMPADVLADFTAETGIAVRYVSYDTSEEAAARLAGGEQFDLAVLENHFIPALAKQGLLRTVPSDQIPNLSHVAPAFLGLAYDPENRYSIPYTWGTTGLVIRSDLAGGMHQWEDLWDHRYQGKVGLRPMPRDMIGMALKSLGYPANSEDRRALEDALDKLRLLRGSVQMVGEDPESAYQALESGQVVALVGWVEDYLLARDNGLPVTYVLPDEGVILWGDSYIIPASSAAPAAAEALINFLLRPDISARITNATGYVTANADARSLIDPQLSHDPAVIPPDPELVKTIARAEVLLPLSPAGEQAYADLWQRFESYLKR